MILTKLEKLIAVVFAALFITVGTLAILGGTGCVAPDARVAASVGSNGI